MVSRPNDPVNCTAVTSFVSGMLMIFHVFVERLELIHMTDLTGSWSMNLDVGVTETKWLGSDVREEGDVGFLYEDDVPFVSGYVVDEV